LTAEQYYTDINLKSFWRSQDRAKLTCSRRQKRTCAKKENISKKFYIRDNEDCCLTVSAASLLGQHILDFPSQYVWSPKQYNYILPEKQLDMYHEGDELSPRFKDAEENEEERG
jgi:hypothetical protein